jgi:hypothetical protein
MTTARFQPQAWVNDYAIDVDLEGPEEWEISAEYAADLPTSDDHHDDLDWLKGDPAAPAWVRNHSGPFEIWVEGVR